MVRAKDAATGTTCTNVFIHVCVRAHVSMERHASVDAFDCLVAERTGLVVRADDPRALPVHYRFVKPQQGTSDFLVLHAAAPHARCNVHAVDPLYARPTHLHASRCVCVHVRVLTNKLLRHCCGALPKLLCASSCFHDAHCGH